MSLTATPRLPAGEPVRHQHVGNLADKVGDPRGPRHLGVNAENIGHPAMSTVIDACLSTNPRSADRSEVEALFMAAL
jgi:1,3-propanediol dehydrogenase